MKAEKVENLIKMLEYLILSGNVPFLRGTPGIGKSSVAVELAERLNLKYIDLRLSMMEETDFGFPRIEKNVVKFVLPDWAIDESPRLIHLEEINRASKSVRNAILGLILEKKLHNYELKNAYFIASGNTDGDISELDSALQSRLVSIDFKVDLESWVVFAKKHNLNESIINFLIDKPHFLNEVPTDENETFANPRGWHKLSNLLNVLLENGEDIISFISNNDIVPAFVGTKAGYAFIKWLIEDSSITLKKYLTEDIKVSSKSALSIANELALLGTDVLTKEYLTGNDKIFREKIEKIKKVCSLIADDLCVNVICKLIDSFEDETKLSIITEVLKEEVEMFRKSLFSSISKKSK